MSISFFHRLIINFARLHEFIDSIRPIFIAFIQHFIILSLQRCYLIIVIILDLA